MLEFAIILPLLVLLFFGILEVGLALNTYLTLAQVTREGVRYSSHTPRLQEGSFDSAVCTGECGNHKQIHDQVLKIIGRHGLDKRFATPSNLKVITSLDTTAAVEGRVRVSISVAFRGWLLMKGFTIGTTDKGPYLFR